MLALAVRVVRPLALMLAGAVVVLELVFEASESLAGLGWCHVAQLGHQCRFVPGQHRPLVGLEPLGQTAHLVGLGPPQPSRGERSFGRRQVGKVMGPAARRLASP